MKTEIEDEFRGLRQKIDQLERELNEAFGRIEDLERRLDAESRRNDAETM
ncbi:MAG: hypothetical protein GY757_19085 [bacterium]|nr:hypothetical protein [bacterium]